MVGVNGISGVDGMRVVEVGGGSDGREAERRQERNRSAAG